MRIKSGHSEACYRYAHHMGSGEQLPAEGWAHEHGCDNRVEVSGAEFPQLTAAQLEEKAVAILRNRYTVRAKLERPSRGVKQVPRPAQGDRASAAAAARSESIRPSHSFN
jgi:hypothetical protein